MLARAARSAAAAASRFARFHEPAALSLSLSTKAESHAPTSSDRAASVAVPPPVTAARDASPASSHLKEQKPEGREEFVAEEKDLESDEALWALYERWCKAFDQKRDRDDMDHFYKTFKKTVLFGHHVSKANPLYKWEINKFADGKLRWPCGSPDPLHKRIEEEFDDPCEFIVIGDGKLYKRVFADYRVVDDRLYVHLPKGIDVKTITANPGWEWPTYDR